MSITAMIADGILVGCTRDASDRRSGHAMTTGLFTLQTESLFSGLGIFGMGQLAAHFITPRFAL